MNGVRQPTANPTIGQYLIQRLQDYGIRDIFGIPGDYVLSFYGQLEQSDLNVVGCTREDCAGFAADAYARLNGIGAVCVTYCVGGFSVANSIAGAFAEKSPVVVISGSPGMNERQHGTLLHHKVRDFRTQLEVFEKLTICAVELSDPLEAFALIDQALEAADRYKRPVYIELPRDMVHVVPPMNHASHRPPVETHPQALDEAIREVVQRLQKAERPLILAGVEIHRFGLQDSLLALAEATRIPIAATILGKSVVSEQHPLFVGLYEGAIGHPEITQYVEESDLILMLGTFLTDINMGIFTANLKPDQCVLATSEQLRISHHYFHDVPLEPFLQALIAEDLSPTTRQVPDPLRALRRMKAIEVQPNEPLRTSRMMSLLNRYLDPQTVVIADVGDCLFAATELVTHDRGEFLSPAYYTSMGFGIPAGLGAAVAKSDHRIVILVGDGAFQMTGQEMSTLIRMGAAPIVILLDNHGYGTERYLHPGEWKYNEIQPWNYARLPEIYGGARGTLCTTEKEFESALTVAWDDRSKLHLLQCRLAENDASETLKNIAARMGERVG
ncbi:Indole-3-pyruvate decarboxylase [Roseimaritima multifibrata]|uniref:Indole-3-pyruvate decarboxylase n=1 Tax=Roseimaritima multifibrata TaxID=1930274 RepID=A0A517MDG6_9BACT|nr:thiamine pyrophosphate-binding protein [Roseimaritima multifibrata]QDS92934.1 Indole-3-pyruvate decarboxylase [Roseimaritima multifibrata]